MIEMLLLLILTGIAVGRFPMFRMNRATLALLGAVVLILAGGIGLKQAIESIHAETLILLLSMMIFTANLRLAGFFKLAGSALARFAHTPSTLLLLVIVLSALLSAFFINDSVALMLTPLLVELTLCSRLNPIPYLIALAVSANIGSMATQIGNPQNILIAGSSGMGFFEFTGPLLIPTILSLILAGVLILVLFPKDFAQRPRTLRLPLRKRVYKPLILKSFLSLGLMITGLSFGWGITLSALTGAAVLLFTRRVKPEKVLREVDWPLLVFFGGLFVITRCLETRPLFAQLLQTVTPLMQNGLWWLSLVSAGLSNLISNVPAVMVLKTLIPAFPDPDKAWLILASSSTLAGNLTLMGSVCNLIVAEAAKGRGVHLSFGAYLKVGLPLTVLTVGISTFWLISWG